VKLGFRAPRDIVIDRGELRQAKLHTPKPEPRRRTVSQVLWERKNAPGGAGCCDNYANQMGCFCLSEALPDPMPQERPAPYCPECKGSGYAIHPQNGWVRNSRRCSKGCDVRCSVCGNPNCDNPDGQH
jgi:hypothetical protein